MSSHHESEHDDDDRDDRFGARYESDDDDDHDDDRDGDSDHGNQSNANVQLIDITNSTVYESDRNDRRDSDSNHGNQSNANVQLIDVTNPTVVLTETPQSRDNARDLYQFDLSNDQVTASYKFDNDRIKSERLDSNDSYALQADGTILKTEMKSHGTETEIYSDVDGDGWFSKVSHAWTSHDNESAGVKLHKNDWYEYAGTFADYQLVSSNERVLVKDIVSATEDSLESAKRLIFKDKAIALDFAEGDSSYHASKLIGAALGKDHISEYLSAGLSLFDSGHTVGEVIALIDRENFIENFLGDSSSSAYVRHLYQNVFGSGPDEALESQFVSYLNENRYTRADLLEIAVKAPHLETSIDLVGLRTNGLVYDLDVN